MVWPKTDPPLAVGVELFVNGDWEDITDDVSADGITISRGRPDEASSAEPSSLKMTLNNEAGKYSPRNPGSPLYGAIGRNTPVRAWVKLGATRLVQKDVTQYFQAPDSVPLSVSGDIDMRVDVEPETWRPSAGAWVGLLKGGSYGLWITAEGKLVCHFTNTSLVTENITSTVPIPGAVVGRKAVRVVLDVNNGSGGHTVQYYVAPSMAGPWTLFDSVNVSGTVAIRDNANGLTSQTSTELGQTAVYSLEVRAGASLVTSPVFSSATEGASSLSDAQGNTWSAVAGATVTAKHLRFVGEIAKWPQSWGPKGSPQAVVSVTAAGVTRRLLQGASPVVSALHRGCAAIGSSLVAYWPLEDGSASSRFSGWNRTPAGLALGTVSFGAFDDIDSSAPLPRFNGGSAVLVCPPSTATGKVQARFAASIPTSIPDQTVLANVTTTSTLALIQVRYNTGGTVSAYGYTDEGALAVTAGPVPLPDKPSRLSVEAEQSGIYVTLRLVTLAFGASSGTLHQATSGGANTLGAPKAVVLNPAQAAEDLAFGHVTVENVITSVFDLASQMRGYSGEDAPARVRRLAAENNVPLTVIGEGGQALGPQPRGTFLELLRDAEATDGGFLYESRADGSLLYRTLDGLSGQQPAATIAYTDNLLRPFLPVEDDQQTSNRVTVTRDGGGSATVEQSDGALGTATVGVYDSSLTLSLAADAQAQHQAAWRVHLGTVDEPRWPEIGVHFDDSWWANKPELVRDLLSLDVGDRLDVTDLPDWLPPFPVAAIVQGYVETLRPFSYELLFNCSPAEPYRTTHWTDDGRWANDTTVVQSAINSTTATMPVLFYSGPRWTAADGSFDVLVGGEVMTVTGVSGAGPTQLFTVVRGVNGYQAAHSGLTPVTLYRPTYWAL